MLGQLGTVPNCVFVLSVLLCTDRARWMCTSEMLDDELNFLSAVFIKNGYPPQFIKKNLEPRMEFPKVTTVEKKRLYISLPFKGDTAAQSISRRLTNAVMRTYNAAVLNVPFCSKPVLVQRLKDKLPISSTSCCVYSFSCSCGASYIGKTTRRLSERVREHHPAWIGTGMQKTINSAVVAHLVDSNHVVNIHSAFNPIHRIPNRYPRGVKYRLLSAAEAIAIRLRNPDLCSHKRFVQALGLPWPAITRSGDATVMATSH